MKIRFDQTRREGSAGAVWGGEASLWPNFHDDLRRASTRLHLETEVNPKGWCGLGAKIKNKRRII
jgi:hypothetical protein